MELLQAFGIDARLLIAQLINFLILVGILYKLGYKPILAFVKERQKKIEQGVVDAERAEHKMRQAEEAHKEALSRAHKEAQEILARSREQAEVQAQAIIAKTQDQARDIVNRAKKEIKEQQVLSQQEVKREAAALVVGLTEKLLRKKMTAAADEAFIKDSLKEMHS
ncbi:MAG: F0F1 ATP synthase subunit B [bacterium]|nr:F0F1 ATP synthase subunit B [bacterium]